MSRGCGVLQRAIMHILRGHTRVFTGGPLTLSEVREELIAAGLLAGGDQYGERLRVRRALTSLRRRGLAVKTWRPQPGEDRPSRFNPPSWSLLADCPK